MALAFALAYQIPDWPAIFLDINSRPMIDRTVYTQSLLFFNLTIDYITEFDVVSFFSREWLWATFLSQLHRGMGLSPDQIFFLITTLVLWRFAFEVGTRAGWLYVLLLLNPLVVDFAFSQLRLAFAMALISFVWRGQRNSAVTVVVYVACAAIHTSIVLFALMHFLANRLDKVRFSQAFYLAIAGFMISIAIGPLREIILGLIGDRRAEYHDMSSSIVYLFFWLIMWAMLLYRWKNTIRSVDGRYALLILSIIAMNVVVAGYSTRFIVAAFPSMLITMSQWRSMSINELAILFISYSVLQWLYWLGI